MQMAKAIATKLFQEEDLGLSPERPEGPRVVVQKLTEDLYKSILTCNTDEFHKLSSKSADEESALILSNARLAQKSVDTMDFDMVAVLFKYILNNCFMLAQETGSIGLALQMYTSQTAKGQNMQVRWCSCLATHMPKQIRLDTLYVKSNRNDACAYS
jgi:hypothetical protein